jgi:hypothetical protein
MTDTIIKEMQEKAVQKHGYEKPENVAAPGERPYCPPYAYETRVDMSTDELDTLIASSVRAGYEAWNREVREIVKQSQLAELIRFYMSNRGSGHTYASVKGVENVQGAYLLVADEHQKQNTGLPREKQIALSGREIQLGGRRCAIVVDHYALQQMFTDLSTKLDSKI